MLNLFTKQHRSLTVLKPHLPLPQPSVLLLHPKFAVRQARCHVLRAARQWTRPRACPARGDVAADVKFADSLVNDPYAPQRCDVHIAERAPLVRQGVRAFTTARVPLVAYADSLLQDVEAHAALVRGRWRL